MLKTLDILDWDILDWDIPDWDILDWGTDRGVFIMDVHSVWLNTTLSQNAGSKPKPWPEIGGFWTDWRKIRCLERQTGTPVYVQSCCMPRCPVHNIIFEPKYGGVFETKPRSIATLDIRYQDPMKHLKLHLENKDKSQFPETPP